MRQMFGLVFVVLSFAGVTLAQDGPYNVVFDLTSNDSLAQRSVMRWVNEISTSYPDAKLEVVMYGKGFELVMPERSKYTQDLEKVVNNPNVQFRVCEMALKNNSVPKTALLHGVGTVPDGIREIVQKQHQGWGYIKVAR